MVTRRASQSSASRASWDVSSPSSSEFNYDSDPSTDSESPVAPSVRRTRVSRRWRQSHVQSVTTRSLLPSQPASTSLWTTREKQFDKFRSSFLSLPVPHDVVRIEKTKGYSLHVMSVYNWVLPDSIVHTTIPESDEDKDEPLVTLGVHVSLFHAVSKRFFGNTWVSPELAIDPFQIKQTRHPKNGTLRYVLETFLLNFRAYFVSDIVDGDCVGVLELVAYEKDPDSKATVRVFGCGWTLLPLFARQPVQSGTKNFNAMHSSGDSVSVFTGSPRALWELNPDAWSAQEKQESTKLYYQVVPYEPMLSIAMFVKKNELVGALDPIPGLKNGNLANIDMGTNPKMLLQEAATDYDDSLASFAKIASLVPKSVQLEEPFELHVVATRVAINLRDEIEANLVSRLKISRRAIHQGAVSLEGEVSARVLKLSLHNGRCFLTRQFTVPLKADPNGGDTLVCVRNQSKLRGFVCHPNMAIVVVLQYTVHFRIIWPSKLKQHALETNKPPLPEEDVVLVTMGARALVPSDGKKLYLYDKEHHATAVSTEPLTARGGVQEEHRRVLHVELLSGAPCRPYSDNTLYTPPDQVTRSLQHGVKDSFAFCDLKIMIDGELPATGLLIEDEKAATSPLDDSNQTTEATEDCAAEEWARKLLDKASSNPLLAHTLNALAASLKTVEPGRKTPSPIKKQVNGSAASPTRVREASTSELSRASKTLLTRYGYMDPHDKPPKETPGLNRQASIKCDVVAKSIETEVRDPFKAHEIRFHFAAYRARSKTPSRVYFTFQFYTFPATRTETLRLSQAFENGARGDIQTFLLMQDTSANKPSLAIQFDVDTTTNRNPLETRRFAEYLKWNNLYVDVWDAESLFQLGTFAIPLHELLRQGKSVKKCQAEVEIAPPLGQTTGSEHDESSADCTVSDGVDGAKIGRIQLLMSCYGLKGEYSINQHVSNPADGQLTAQPLTERTPKHRVRAHPLVDSNAELYRLLSQEGFYRDGKDVQDRKERHNQRQGLSHGNTLTPKEIAILCELFASRKTRQSTRNRPTRITCDLEGKTGLLALLSLRTRATVVHPATSVSKPVETQHVVVSQSANLDDLKLVDDLVDKNTDGRVEYRELAQDPSRLPIREHVARVIERAVTKGIHVHDVFAELDTSGDGTLSYEELERGLNRLGISTDADTEDVRKLLTELDQDHDGVLSYTEFLTSLGISIHDNKQEVIKEKLKDITEDISEILRRLKLKGVSLDQVFVHLDADRNGTLSVDEFTNALNQLLQLNSADSQVGDTLQQFEQDAVAAYVKTINADDDCQIDYHEFLTACGVSGHEMQAAAAQFHHANRLTAERKLVKLLVRACAGGLTFQDMFEHFDANSDGEISLMEFHTSLTTLLLAQGLSSDDAALVAARFDTNRDGAISRREFQDFGVEFEKKQHALAAIVTPHLDKLSTLELSSTLSGAKWSSLCHEELGISIQTLDTELMPLMTYFGLMSENGELNIHELCAFCRPQQAAKPPARVSEKDIAVKRLRTFLAKAKAQGVDLKKSFTHFDTDNDGQITRAELKHGLIALECFQEMKEDEIDSLLAQMDEDGSGEIDFTEFRALLDENEAAVEVFDDKDEVLKKLKALMGKAVDKGVSVDNCFAHFDKDGDGKIKSEEFSTAMTELGLTADKTVIDSVLRLLDRDENGTISLSEFNQLLSPASTVEEQTPTVEEKLHKLLLSAEASGVDVKQCFAHFDTDKSGVITTDEFVTAIKQLPGFKNVRDVDTLSIVQRLDQDASGSVSLEEFEAFLRRQALSSATAAVETEDKAQVVVKLSDADVEATSATHKEQAIDTRTEDVFPTEGGDESVPIAVDSPREPEETATNAMSYSRDDTTEPATEAIASSEVASRDNSQAKRRPSERASSFTNPESVAAVCAPFRRTKTAPNAVGVGSQASAPVTCLLSKEASEGLSKLKTLLQTASDKGVAIQQSFNHFDKKGTGFLTYKEFITGLRELGVDFINLSDEDMTAMAKSLDCKQHHKICVQDFGSFMETSVLEGTEKESTNTREFQTTTSKRPPLLRRTSSSKIPAKKPPRPSTGTQSARETVTDTSSTVIQDKSWMEPPKATNEDKTTAQTTSNEVENSSKDVNTDKNETVANPDCNYIFSSNPEVRAVELKLRQTALEAYERGILPLRVVSKFLELNDDRRGFVPGLTGRPRQRSELLRVEFLQVLMELGFTLLSDRQEDDEYGVNEKPKPMTKMNDHLYARQLERLARYRQHLQRDESKAHKQLVRAVAKTKQHNKQQAQDSLGRFEDEKKQLLRVLSYYRDGHKKSLVYSLLRQQVTTSLTLFPSFGDLLFFELPFTNPYNHNDRFRIELLLPSSRELAVVLDLEIVRNSDEWAFYRQHLPLAYGFLASNAHIEDEMIDDHDEIVMESHDQLHIPMRLRWLDTSDTFSTALKTGNELKHSNIPVSVVLKSCSHGHTVALFNLTLQPQPFVCHRVLRFSHPASSIWRWKLRFPRDKFVVCMDPSVAMELLRDGADHVHNNGLVSFKCRVGDYPALESFFVVLYDDKYYAQVFQVWQIRIQSKLRVDVHAVLGQSVRHELVIKGDGREEATKRHVMCFTSMQHRDLVQFRPANVFALVPQAFNRIELAFCAVEKRADMHLVLVNLVDVETHELVGAWSVHVTLALPVITKTYELRLPMGRAAQKKISYSNPWDQPQTIVLRSSAPKLLVPRESVLHLPSSGQAFLRLAFAARPHSAAASEDLYLFINDKHTDQNEECLLFQVAYE